MRDLSFAGMTDHQLDFFWECAGSMRDICTCACLDILVCWVLGPVYNHLIKYWRRRFGGAMVNYVFQCHIKRGCLRYKFGWYKHILKWMLGGVFVILVHRKRVFPCGLAGPETYWSQGRIKFRWYRGIHWFKQEGIINLIDEDIQIKLISGTSVWRGSRFVLFIFISFVSSPFFPILLWILRSENYGFVDHFQDPMKKRMFKAPGGTWNWGLYTIWDGEGRKIDL